ncbi:MAG TPA: DUF2569 domain-containing protein [Terracidiphilus sp.]|jgi:hypothetical protein|nr:DUF2569 domain-containing protein [Terracidiphilus sp.]
MICAQCASELEPGAAICTTCGAPEAAAAVSATAPPLSVPTFSMGNDLEGIGGWLILVALGLVISPFYILASSLSTFLPLFDNPQVQAWLQTHPGMQALMFFEIVTNLIFVIFLIALNYLFFTKRRSFPNYFIFYLGLHFIVLLSDTAIAHAILPSVPLSSRATMGLARSVIGVALWIPYFLVSKRVKATFVR